MGLGLFETPLYLNPKCLVFSFFIIIIYYLPKPFHLSHHIIMIFLLGTSAYIAMSWYDMLYDCIDKFGPTYLGWMTKELKPEFYRKHYQTLPIKYQKRIRNIDITILIILAITFIYPFYFK
jgi:hypothetical protein